MPFLNWFAKKTREELISDLFHKDWKKREKAKNALDRAHPQWPADENVRKRIPEFIAALENSDGYFMETMAEILGIIGDPRAVEPLVDILNDSVARQAAARALGLIGDERAVSSLIEAQKAGDKYFREIAMDSLAKIDPDWPESTVARKLFPELISSLKKSDGALSALNRIYPEWAKSVEARKQIPGFIAALEEGDEAARKAVAKTLCLIGDERAVDALANAALIDSNISVRKASQDALKRIAPGWPESENARARVPEFVSALEDEDENIRKVAAEALLFIGNETAIVPLIRALTDKNDDVCVSAVEALKRIDQLWPQRKEAREQFDELLRALEYGNRYAQKAAAKALAVIGDARALHPLMNEIDRVADATVSGKMDSQESCYRRSCLKKAVIRIVDSNRELHNAYKIFCGKCCHRNITRTKNLRPLLGEQQHVHKEVSIPVCSTCRSSMNLMTGIDIVIGIIGGDTPEFDHENGVVKISLWNEREKKARRADVELLEIRADGVENYHLAINSVIIELTADAGKSKNLLKNIPVFLKETPAISRETMNMLRDMFNVVDEEH